MDARDASHLVPRASAEESRRRTSTSTGASMTRQSRASRVQKSWIIGDDVADGTIVHDAAQAGLQEQEAMKIVKCTTRFATVMCVIIAIVKVNVYLYFGAEVVRTSALDSLGDLMANIITLYTGYRMTNVDLKRYPVGQKKFQSIGCLVFSTLMFALMFGNALSNLESLMPDQSVSCQTEDEAEKWQELKTQNLFLGCCASYKFCLWMYCILYAIPKSGSSVLVALATDKRNDFICTSFVITATFFAAVFPTFTTSFIAEDHVDPLVSLLLSGFIMYTWSELMTEHMTLLSEEASNDEFCNGVKKEVFDVVKGSPCSVADNDIKIYLSGMGHTIEVTLTVDPGSTEFAVVNALMQRLRNRLRPLEDVDRVLLTTTSPLAGA